ncbi:hypothetical protein DSUL_20584 [Desulfovibrionales bacterium]
MQLYYSVRGLSDSLLGLIAWFAGLVMASLHQSALMNRLYHTICLDRDTPSFLKEVIFWVSKALELLLRQGVTGIVCVMSCRLYIHIATGSILHTV